MHCWDVVAHWLRDDFQPEVRGFNSRSSCHVGTLGKFVPLWDLRFQSSSKTTGSTTYCRVLQDENEMPFAQCLQTFSGMLWHKPTRNLQNSVSQTVVRGPLGVREALTGVRGKILFSCRIQREKTCKFLIISKNLPLKLFFSY